MAELAVAAPIDADHDYPLVGETLGLWRLVRGLGRGGMGEVYEAEYDYLHLLSLRYPAGSREVIRHELTALGRLEQARLASEMLGTQLPAEARFAIKVCNARSGTAGHRRFLQEAEMAQRLGDHPYIVTVHAVNVGGLPVGSELGKFDFERGRFRDIAFMVMDLAARDYDHTRLTLPEAVHIVRCIATALDHAHSHGIIHRDLKPENILGTVQHPLLTDFGIAKELDHTQGLTRTGQIIGTLDYMSPEQATDAKRVDHRSDIYSLGVVLYEFATQGGLPYFHKTDRESCLAAIRSEKTDPRWPREHVPGFPPSLERVALKAMAHRMEDRYQAMSELITDLDRYSRGEWVPWWGRVRVLNFWRYVRRCYPRVIWGSATLLTLTALALLALWAKPYLDGDRRALTQQLDEVERVVRQIEAGTTSQPDRKARDQFEQVDEALRHLSTRYPDLVQRWRLLGRRLLAGSRLDAHFAGSGVEAADGRAAKEQFELAAGVETPLWTLGDDGLTMSDEAKLEFGPFGTGSAFIFLHLRTGERFRCEVEEHAGPVHHRTRWRVFNHALQLTTQEDEKEAVILHQDPLPPGEQLTELRLWLEVRGDQINSWGWPRASTTMVHRPLRGLAPDASARVRLILPRGSVLMRIAILPTKWPMR